MYLLYVFIFINMFNECLRVLVLNKKIIKVITCVSVKCNELENSALSAILRYCFSLNFFSRLNNCWVVKGVRGLRLGLCFLRLHLSFGGSPLFESETQKANKRLIFNFFQKPKIYFKKKIYLTAEETIGYYFPERICWFNEL